MKEQPTLTTERLILRPHSQTDAKIVQKLIGDRVVADTLFLSLILIRTGWQKNGLENARMSSKKINRFTLRLPLKSKDPLSAGLA